jgi:hypothetical protein
MPALQLAAGYGLQAAVARARRVQRHAQRDDVAVRMRKYRPVLVPADFGAAFGELEVDLGMIELDRPSDQVGCDVAKYRVECGFHENLVKFGRAGNAPDAWPLRRVEGVEVDMRRLLRQAGGFRADSVDRSVQALQQRRL